MQALLLPAAACSGITTPAAGPSPSFPRRPLSLSLNPIASPSLSLPKSRIITPQSLPFSSPLSRDVLSIRPTSLFSGSSVSSSPISPGFTSPSDESAKIAQVAKRLESDLGIDARPFLSNQDRDETKEQEHWHDCSQYLYPDEDFSDLDLLHFFRMEGSDKSGSRIFRIVGKYFPAPVVSAGRLKKYILHKLCSEFPEGPFCIIYMHTSVQTEDNSPGMTIVRWIYEELPSDCKDRLQTLYFIHPGLRSRLAFATLGRFFLSGGLYWKIKYVSRLQYLWDDMKKGAVEIPEFVKNHDDILEHRPLTDYGIEPDPLHLTEVPATAYSFGRYDERWASRDYMS